MFDLVVYFRYYEAVGWETCSFWRGRPDQRLLGGGYYTRLSEALWGSGLKGVGREDMYVVGRYTLPSSRERSTASIDRLLRRGARDDENKGRRLNG